MECYFLFIKIENIKKVFKKMFSNILYMDNTNEIILTALQKAKKKYYEKIKNDPEYKAKRNSPEFKAKLRASCNKYYNKVKNNDEFKKKSIRPKKTILYQKKFEPLLFEINL